MFPKFNAVSIVTDTSNVSVFSNIDFLKTERKGMFLSDPIGANNFRIRESMPGYITDWHMAGDPTLIIIQMGTLRISLHDGQHKDFKTGDMFFASDNLPSNVIFDGSIHGHKAEVIGDEILRAIHIKLG